MVSFEEAMRGLAAYIEAKKPELESQGLGSSHIDEAIRELWAGNPESVFEILDEDSFHLQRVMCGEFDSPEFGEESNTKDRTTATRENACISDWYIAIATASAAELRAYHPEVVE